MTRYRLFVGLSLLMGAGACFAPTPIPEIVRAPVGRPSPSEKGSEKALATGVPYVEGKGAVLGLPIEGAGSIAFRIAFYTGSVDDPPGQEGLTKLTARLMAEGGIESQSYAELLRTLYPMSADIDVEVDKEQTVFSGEVHPDHGVRFAELLADVIRVPRLDEAAFERIRRDMIDDIEKRLRFSNDEALGQAALQLMLYKGDHPYAHGVGGTVASLKRLTREDVKAHLARVFGRRRLLIGWAGAFQPEAVKHLKERLRDLPEGTPRRSKIQATEPPSENEVLVIHKPGAKAIAVSMGYPHWAYRGHADWPALALIQSYFGEHRQRHGILMDELRGKRGLNYGDYAYLEHFIEANRSRFPRLNVARRRQHFEIWLRPVNPTDVHFAIRLALLYLDRLVRNGLSETDVRETNQFLQGYTRLFAQTPMRRLGYMLDDHFYGTRDYLGTLRQDLATLTAPQVNEALRRHLVPQPIKIAIVAPDPTAIIDGFTANVPVTHAYTSDKPPEVLTDDQKAAALKVVLRGSSIRIMRVEEVFQGK